MMRFIYKVAPPDARQTHLRTFSVFRGQLDLEIAIDPVKMDRASDHRLKPSLPAGTPR